MPIVRVNTNNKVYMGKPVMIADKGVEDANMHGEQKSLLRSAIKFGELQHGCGLHMALLYCML